MALARTTSPAIISSSFQGASNSQAYTSNTFSPPAGSVIVVSAHAQEAYNNPFATPTITDSLGAHLTWTLVQHQSDNSFAGVTGSAAVFWAHCPSSQTNMTVTVTQSCTAGQTIWYSSVAVGVWTGADTTAPIGTSSKGYSTSAALGVSITPAGAGSALLLTANNNGVNNSASTAGTGEYLINETHVGPSFAQVWYGNSGGPTIPATTQTLDLNGTTPRWNWIAYEVKALAAVDVMFTGSTPGRGSGQSSSGTTTMVYSGTSQTYTLEAPSGYAAFGSGQALPGVMSGSSVAVAVGSVASGSGQAAAGSSIGSATFTGSTAAGSGCAAGGQLTGSARLIGSTAQGSGQAAAGSLTGGATHVGSTAAGSGRGQQGSASGSATGTLTGSTAYGSGTAEAGRLFGSALVVGSTAAGSGQAVTGAATAGQSATFTGGVAASSGQATVGSSVGTASGTFAGQIAIGSGSAQGGTFPFSGLFTGGSATGSGQTLAGALTAAAVFVGAVAAASGQARSGLVSADQNGLLIGVTAQGSGRAAAGSAVAGSVGGTVVVLMRIPSPRLWVRMRP